jgi:hypothetical protein
MHNLVDCFALGYAMERELVVWPDHWVYHEKGYQDVFLPLSRCRSGIDEKIEWQADLAGRFFLDTMNFDL